MRRLVTLRAILVAGCLAAILLSRPLWISTRPFPLVPLGDLLPPFPAPLDTIVLVAFAVALILLLLPRFTRWATAAAFALAALLALQDQMRLQPWFYQYLLMLGVLGLASRDAPPRGRFGLDEAGALGGLRLIMGCTYLWSGLHKINLEFIEVGFPWLMRPFVGEAQGPALDLVVHLVPWLEAGFGAGLLMQPTRRVCVVLACSMHAFILASIGPWGHDWNPVVWPWNLVMPLLLVKLFWGGSQPLREILVGRALASRALLLLYGVLPATNAAGFWDSYLSCALYSYSNQTAFFELDEQQLEQLPVEIEGVVRVESTGRVRVLSDAWSFATVGVPVYPELRVFRRLHAALCEQAGTAQPPVLTVHTRARQGGARTLRSWHCDEDLPFRTVTVH